MVLVATLGVIVSLYGYFSAASPLQWLRKGLVAAMAVVLVLGPPLPVALGLAAGVVALSALSYLRTRRLTVAPGGDVASATS